MPLFFCLVITYCRRKIEVIKYQYSTVSCSSKSEDRWSWLHFLFLVVLFLFQFFLALISNILPFPLSQWLLPSKSAQSAMVDYTKAQSHFFRILDFSNKILICLSTALVQRNGMKFIFIADGRIYFNIRRGICSQMTFCYLFISNGQNNFAHKWWWRLQVEEKQPSILWSQNIRV